MTEIALDTDLVTLHVADGVATLTLNRPDARNALSLDMIAAMETAIEKVEAGIAAESDSVRVMILRVLTTLTRIRYPFCGSAGWTSTRQPVALQSPVYFTSNGRRQMKIPTGSSHLMMYYMEYHLISAFAYEMSDKPVINDTSDCGDMDIRRRGRR